MYKYTRKEKIPSFFLQQARKYMLKCSKIKSVYCKKEKGRANK